MMNKNIIIAKNLIKLAKSLIALKQDQTLKYQPITDIYVLSTIETITQPNIDEIMELFSDFIKNKVLQLNNIEIRGGKGAEQREQKKDQFNKKTQLIIDETTKRFNEYLTNLYKNKRINKITKTNRWSNFANEITYIVSEITNEFDKKMNSFKKLNDPYKDLGIINEENIKEIVNLFKNYIHQQLRIEQKKGLLNEEMVKEWLTDELKQMLKDGRLEKITGYKTNREDRIKQIIKNYIHRYNPYVKINNNNLENVIITKQSLKDIQDIFNEYIQDNFHHNIYDHNISINSIKKWFAYKLQRMYNDDDLPQQGKRRETFERIIDDYAFHLMSKESNIEHYDSNGKGGTTGIRKRYKELNYYELKTLSEDEIMQLSLEDISYILHNIAKPILSTKFNGDHFMQQKLEDATGMSLLYITKKYDQGKFKSQVLEKIKELKNPVKFCIKTITHFLYGKASRYKTLNISDSKLEEHERFDLSNYDDKKIQSLIEQAKLLIIRRYPEYINEIDESASQFKQRLEKRLEKVQLQDIIKDDNILYYFIKAIKKRAQYRFDKGTNSNIDFNEINESKLQNSEFLQINQKDYSYKRQLFIGLLNESIDSKNTHISTLNLNASEEELEQKMHEILKYVKNNPDGVRNREYANSVKVILVLYYSIYLQRNNNKEVIRELGITKNQEEANALAKAVSTSITKEKIQRVREVVGKSKFAKLNIIIAKLQSLLKID